MIDSILVASPKEEWTKETRKALEASGYQAESVGNGKDCQTRISKTKFEVVIIDFELTNHSAFEVLKFIKITHPSIKIIMVIQSKEQLNASYFGMSSLSKAGITDVIYGMPTIDKIKKCLNSIQGIDSWKKIQSENVDRSETALKVKDTDFMQINIEDFYSSNITFFDHYIRLGPNNYKKILHKGDVFNPERVRKYQNDGVQFLYLLTSERQQYINFINELVKNFLIKNVVPANKIIIPIRNVTTKYMEEVYTKGLKPELIKEGKTICHNMYEFIKKDKNISKTLDSLHDRIPSAFDHSFLVAFFSILICKQLDWAGARTIDTIAMGALLHDIGIISLPGAIRDITCKNLKPDHQKLYKQHPKLGVDLLKKSSLINEQVLQIVYEHHEHVDGSGYPNQLSGTRIYPLAKIVSTAESFSELLSELKIQPRLALKTFLSSRETLICHDPIIVKSLAKGITGHDE